MSEPYDLFILYKVILKNSYIKSIDSFDMRYQLQTYRNEQAGVCSLDFRWTYVTFFHGIPSCRVCGNRYLIL
jgi:hypothetical protein